MASTQFIVELLILTSPIALIWNQWIFTNARRNKVLDICAQMKTATRPDADLKRFCDLVSIFYVPYWLQCPLASEAAVNDLEFYRAVINYIKIDEDKKLIKLRNMHFKDTGGI